MKRKSALIVAVVVAVLLLAYMVTFRVRFDETAVVTTFGRAGEGAVLNADGQGAGLYFKWPWPIQDVRRYDARIRVLETPPEQGLTRDQQTIVAGSYIWWRIADPLAFERALQNVGEAEAQLRSRMRNAGALLNRYTFDELTHRDPKQIKLGLAEDEMLAALRKELPAQEYGVEIVSARIASLGLPADVTGKVFERMASRQRALADRYRHEGDAIADTVKQEARSAKDRILSFAERRAQAIRADGAAKAAEYIGVFQKDEEFAIFLREVEALRKTLKNNTTFLLDTDTMPFHLLKGAKGAGEQK